jgi:pyruvate-formate lyase-activating enzyme
VPVNEILIRLRELEYYNTVVVTGGEITLHFKAAISIMNALQAEGITTLFSTNGLFPDRVTAMCQYADAVKIDIKDTRGKYRDTSGQDAYDLVMESLSNASRFTNVEFKIIIHEHTTKDDIEAILRDVKSATGFPSNVAVQFQPVRDFLNAGLIEPSINNVMMMCAEANPRPQIALLKHYGTVERIYRLIDEDWIVFREKEIPLRFDWGTPHE